MPCQRAIVGLRPTRVMASPKRVRSSSSHTSTAVPPTSSRTVADTPEPSVMRNASGMRSLAAVWPVPAGLRMGPAVTYWSTNAPMKLIISVVSTSSVPKRTRR